ncbi:hypothetical protein [Salinilacihabitans rarus]|uniref:hypothetical protein n=1 Tax=Salinilacihabitans rarus TaxID=2961596 RepID=UPI0020C91098|nr:hypothetical protein [Salinilacihabitans rarus]
MLEVPLQLIDQLLLDFHVGHVLLVAFVLAILATIPVGSLRVLGLTIITFGAIFLLTPVEAAGETYLFRLAGVALLVVGPMLYVGGR